MSEQLLVMADNLFSVAQYPGHVVTGQEEAAGYEAYHVATNRRQLGDAWRPTTANADRYVQTRANQLRAASCLVIDRNSNLLTNARAGNTSRIQLLGSNDNFTTSRTVLDITLATVPGGSLAGAPGCVTDEDAWLKTFPVDAFYDWRLVVKAMGASVIPSIGGVWLGLAWQPTVRASAPGREDENHRLTFSSSSSTYGWEGRGRVAAPRYGTLHLRERGDADRDILRWHVLGLWMRRGRPAWLVHQRDQYPARAVLATADAGAVAWDDNLLNWIDGLRVLDVPWTESQVAG